MKVILFLTLITFVFSRPQCCENCGSAASVLEEKEILNSLEVLGVDTSSLEHPCMNLPICSVSCDKEFGFKCDAAIYYRVDQWNLVRYLAKCSIQNLQKVRQLLAKEVFELTSKIKNPDLALSLNRVLSVFSEKILRICEEKRVPKTHELEHKWKVFIQGTTFLNLLGFSNNEKLGMSIYEYGNSVWKKAIQYWVQRCECSTLFNPTDSQRAHARSECLKKC